MAEKFSNCCQFNAVRAVRAVQCERESEYTADVQCVTCAATTRALAPAALREESAAHVAGDPGLYERVAALEAESAAVRREVAALRAERAQVVLARELARRLCLQPAAGDERAVAVAAERPRFSALAICKWLFSTIIWERTDPAPAARVCGCGSLLFFFSDERRLLGHVRTVAYLHAAIEYLVPSQHAKRKALSAPVLTHLAPPYVPVASSSAAHAVEAASSRGDVAADVAAVPVPAAGVGVRGGDVGGVAGVDGERRARRAPRRPHGLLQVLARRGRRRGQRRRHQEAPAGRRCAPEKPGRDAGGLRPRARRRRRVLRRARRRRRRARGAPQRRARHPLPQTRPRGAVRPPVQREHAAGHGGDDRHELPAEHGHHDLRAAPQQRPPGPTRGPALPRRGRLRRRHRRQLLPPLPPLEAASRRRRRRQGVVVQDPQGRPVRARHLPALPLRDPRVLRVRHDRADGVRARRGHRNGGVPRRPELRHQEVVRVQVRGVPGEDQSVGAVCVVVVSEVGECV